MAATRRLSELRNAALESIDLPLEPIAVALSGGADSAILAWASMESGSESRSIHVDHSLPASGRLLQAAEEIASRLGIPFQVLKLEPSLAASEAEWRESRYAALEGALEPGEVLATGHTADDQAETVLGNLLRGAGSSGLAGIPTRRGSVARPLLGVWRSQTRELSTLLGLPFHDDPANTDTDIRRNSIRMELIPLLEERYNPRLRESLVRMARSIGSDETLLASIAAEAPIDLEPGRARVVAGVLRTLPRPVSARVVRTALRWLRPPHPGTAAEVDAIHQVALGATPRAEIEGGVVVRREGAFVTLSSSGYLSGSTEEDDS